MCFVGHEYFIGHRNATTLVVSSSLERILVACRVFNTLHYFHPISFTFLFSSRINGDMSNIPGSSDLYLVSLQIVLPSWCYQTHGEEYAKKESLLHGMFQYIPSNHGHEPSHQERYYSRKARNGWCTAHFPESNETNREHPLSSHPVVLCCAVLGKYTTYRNVRFVDGDCISHVV